MANIEYSPKAQEDLQSLREYVIENWGESAAERILRKITSDIRRLDKYPLLGVSLAKQIDNPTDYRYIFTEKNYVFYHIELDIIRIVRILNEQQDYMMQLFGSSSKSEV
ncbi:MAG: type II toxin-antitoxin system RelE/ParE family toxin [Clostridiales bacterium]|jgi:addiction module RelE/StbE family toxin|nr:type II toxin-antitoxin system RelE/ParE family toxin [Clostridiales bacterium]